LFGSQQSQLTQVAAGIAPPPLHTSKSGAIMAMLPSAAVFGLVAVPPMAGAFGARAREYITQAAKMVRAEHLDVGSERRALQSRKSKRAK
jgi:hypothetical protein